VHVTLSSRCRATLLGTLLGTEVLLRSGWRHFRSDFSLEPDATLFALLAATQVTLVRFVNLATRAEIEAGFHDCNVIQRIYCVRKITKLNIFRVLSRRLQITQVWTSVFTSSTKCTKCFKNILNTNQRSGHHCRLFQTDDFHRRGWGLYSKGSRMTHSLKRVRTGLDQRTVLSNSVSLIIRRPVRMLVRLS
jgi:hypothetical protein